MVSLAHLVALFKHWHLSKVIVSLQSPCLLHLAEAPHPHVTYTVIREVSRIAQSSEPCVVFCYFGKRQTGSQQIPNVWGAYVCRGVWGVKGYFV